MINIFYINLDNRVEVSCPIFDDAIKQEIIETHTICWNDNVKARIINGIRDNRYKETIGTPIRSQFATYEYYLNKLKS